MVSESRGSVTRIERRLPRLARSVKLGMATGGTKVPSLSVDWIHDAGFEAGSESKRYVTSTCWSLLPPKNLPNSRRTSGVPLVLHRQNSVPGSFSPGADVAEADLAEMKKKVGASGISFFVLLYVHSSCAAVAGGVKRAARVTAARLGARYMVP